jgi:hypothetical protein
MRNLLPERAEAVILSQAVKSLASADSGKAALTPATYDPGPTLASL